MQQTIIKRALTLALALGLLGSALVAQQGSGSKSGGGGPVNSPEPLTIIALAGGALVAGGLAYRRRKKK